jgi:DNA processing protein
MLERGFVQIVTITPAELLGSLTDVETKNAPRKLYLAGDTSLLQSGTRIAVIGTRHCTRDGWNRTAALTRALVERGMTIVSGLAAGIDTAAHTAAIDAGGRTIAVLGTPLAEAHPPENAPLQAAIATRHLLVSQFRPGSRTAPYNFPMRNRTMALVSDATVIVEANAASGALYQGWEALRLGRPLFLFECLMQDSEHTWPRQMLAHGAAVLTRSNLDAEFANIPALASRSTGGLAGFP